MSKVECELLGRGGGKGGSSTAVMIDGFRRGRGSVLPVVGVLSWPTWLLRAVVAGIDWIDESSAALFASIWTRPLRSRGGFFADGGGSSDA